jgi:serine/threonine protein kinase
MLSPGTIIDGRFEIVDFLGEGGMGTVYSARHQSMDRPIALKMMKSSLLTQEDKVARFRNEARVLSGLVHPNIIAVHAVGIAESGQPYMAMDIVSGKNLSEIIAERGPFNQADALRICSQICNGLQYAHQKKIIHRDIKPSNIIVTESPSNQGVAKLVDFGIAKMLGADQVQLTQTGMAMGSIFYLSPGQMEGRAADPSSDIYALGCTLYEMLTGYPPFRADSVFETAMMHKQNEVVPVNARNAKANIDENVQTIISFMLQKEHHLRYQSAKDLAEDLQRAEQSKSLKFAHKLVTHSPSQGKSKRLRLYVAAILIAGMAIAGTLIYVKSTSETASAPKEDLHQAAEQAVQQSMRMDYKRDLGKNMIPDATKAIELAKKAEDQLLIAQAYLARGDFYQNFRMNQLFAEDQGYALAQADWRAAVEAANSGLLGSKDSARNNLLLKIRYVAQQSIVLNAVSNHKPTSRPDWTNLLTYYKAAQAVVTRRDKDELNSLSHAELLLALTRTDEELLYSARVRTEILRLIGLSDESKTATYLQDIESIKRKHVPAVVREYAKIWGQPPPKYFQP